MEYTVKLNEQQQYKVEIHKQEILVNGEKVQLDLAELGTNHFHIIKDNHSYNVEFVSIDQEAKTCVVKVNGRKHLVNVKDRFDELLHRLGMDTMAAAKGGDVKAPMPGLVLRIFVNEGQEVKKGDNLLVLEAMKMENILKAHADGMVKAVQVKPSDKVEKNQVLMVMQ